MPTRDAVIGRVLALLHHPHVLRGRSVVLPGASEASLHEFEERTGLTVPPELRRWLSFCDGALAGAGGIFGAGPDDPRLEIERFLALHANWTWLGWIPIASDGFGDYYMVATATSREPEDAVFFVDCHEDFDLPSYVVGSDIWHFLVGYLSDELWESWWPFDEERKLTFDPAIAQLASVGALPWKT
jgi:cell wall assembly regulator SMI1